MDKHMIVARSGSQDQSFVLSKIVKIFVNMVLYHLCWWHYVGIVPLKVSETLSAKLYSCVASMFLSVGGETNPKLFCFFRSCG